MERILTNARDAFLPAVRLWPARHQKHANCLNPARPLPISLDSITSPSQPHRFTPVRWQPLVPMLPDRARPIPAGPARPFCSRTPGLVRQPIPWLTDRLTDLGRVSPGACHRRRRQQAASAGQKCSPAEAERKPLEARELVGVGPLIPETATAHLRRRNPPPPRAQRCLGVHHVSE